MGRYSGVLLVHVIGSLFQISFYSRQCYFSHEFLLCFCESFSNVNFNSVKNPNKLK